MKEITKPYIARTKYVLDFLVYEDGSALLLSDNNDCTTKHLIVKFDAANQNITREYLEGKCVKIESPEHSEFVQKLAFNAGFEWLSCGSKLKNTNYPFLFFSLDLSITCGYDDDNRDQVTIPPPPKAESEPKEWPQVGDEVLFRNDLCKVLLAEDASRHIVVEWNGNYVNPHIEDIKKPKAEDEILRDWIQERIGYGIASGFDCEQITHDLLHHCNITKKPQ